MNPESFVEALRQVVIESTSASIQEILENPPGRKPSREIIELSEWYKKSGEINRDMILKLVRESIQIATFGFLCVLDGVRSIEDTEEKGQLKLIFEKGDESVLLNDPEKEYLHNLL